MRFAAILLFAGALFSAQQGKAETRYEKAAAALIAKSPEELARQVASSGFDSLDRAIQVSTEPVFRCSSGGDHFLRAFIYKSDGHTVFQVYHWEEYDTDWKFINRVTFEGPTGPIEGDAETLGGVVTGCSSFSGRCGHRDDIVFEVDEKVLREIAADAKAGSGDVWKYKLAGRFGGEPNAMLLKTEIAALILAVDAIRKREAIPSFRAE